MHILTDELKDAIIDYIFDQTGRNLNIVYPEFGLLNQRITVLEESGRAYRINLEKGTISRLANTTYYSRVPRVKEIDESIDKLNIIRNIILNANLNHQ